MAKLTKTRGRKPLADSVMSVSFGRGAKGPASYSIGVRREDEKGFYNLSPSTEEAFRVLAFFGGVMFRLASYLKSKGEYY